MLPVCYRQALVLLYLIILQRAKKVLSDSIGFPTLDANTLNRAVQTDSFNLDVTFQILNLYFLKKIFFVFLCFEGNYCEEGTLCPPPKANRVNTMVFPR